MKCATIPKFKLFHQLNTPKRGRKQYQLGEVSLIPSIFPSHMMASHGGSKFYIECEIVPFTPSLGYLDLCNFDRFVLQWFKDCKGRLPAVYFKELQDDFFIHNSFKDPKRWERFLLLISYPFALAAPIVRSTFVLDIYRSADSESSGRDAYSPLNVRTDIDDWKNKAIAHSLFKHVYDHKNFNNGLWTTVYNLTKWAVSHWSLLKFSRHLISHVLRYTKVIHFPFTFKISACTSRTYANLMSF